MLFLFRHAMSICLFLLLHICNVNLSCFGKDITANREICHPTQQKQLVSSYLDQAQSPLHLQDTLKALTYIVAGSFLVPKNAQKQQEKLLKIGFHNAFMYTFHESEYYSVVVDTLRKPSDISKLIHKLQLLNIDYFIKYTNN